MSEAPGHPLADRLDEILSGLRGTMTLKQRALLCDEAHDILILLGDRERRVETVERAMKAQNEQLRIAQNRASAHQHQVQVMEEGITSAIGLLDGTSAGLRQTRTRISGRHYEPT